MSIEVVPPEVDVSALALEATLTAIKGAGWTTETLVAIMAAIVALPPGATAAQVWAYATRNLTNPGVAANLGNMQVDGLTQAPAGQKTWPLATDYTAARAANLDAAISSRAVPGDAMALTAAERLIIQALIINDLTPFAGADIAAILADTATINWGDITTIDGLIDDIIADIGVFPTANYATLAAYVEDIRTRLIAIVADTGAINWADITAILADTATINWGDITTIDTVVDSILADTATIAWGDVTAIKTQTDKIPRGVYSMSFWSDNDDDITLTTTATDDFALPSIVVAGLPVGITLVRVVAMLKVALIKTTSGADNAINGATALKVDADPAYGSLVTAIDIPDNSWAVDFSEATERGGDVMIGDNDVKAEVTVNATYYARLENISCDGNNLKLKDVAWGLKVYFTV